MNLSIIAVPDMNIVVPGTGTTDKLYSIDKKKSMLFLIIQTRG